MKFECTAEELRTLTNVDRVEQLREYLEAARTEREKVENDLYDEKQKVRNLEQEKNAHYSDTSPLAQLLKASMQYRKAPNWETSQAFRQKLNDLMPGQISQQLKILREISGVGLKPAKDFLDGKSSFLFPEDEIPF